MKNEAEFNTMIKNSIIKCGGFCHKISDIGRELHGDLPFDLFGCLNNKMIVCESKYNKEPKVLDLHRLEEHQISNLIKVYETFSDKTRICSMFIIGMNFGRNDIRVYYWKNEQLYDIRQRKINKENILKKEFESINYIKVKKGTIDFLEIIK